MSDHEKYKVNSYQSGTTWIVKKERTDSEGFHFRYFDGGLHGNPLYINERGTIERDRYVHNILKYLNESDYAKNRYKPYMEFVLFGKVEKINESSILFHDAYFGALQVTWMLSGEKWKKTPIPDDVLEDLTRFADRTNAVFEGFDKLTVETKSLC